MLLVACCLLLVACCLLLKIVKRVSCLSSTFEIILENFLLCVKRIIAQIDKKSNILSQQLCSPIFQVLRSKTCRVCKKSLYRRISPIANPALVPRPSFRSSLIYEKSLTGEKRRFLYAQKPAVYLCISQNRTLCTIYKICRQANLGRFARLNQNL